MLAGQRQGQTRETLFAQLPRYQQVQNNGCVILNEPVVFKRTPGLFLK